MNENTPVFSTMFFGPWCEELIEDYAAIRYRITETLFSGKSEFQQVDVVKSKGFGTMLFLDGLVMVSERDEFIYHDMITHVPLFAHPDPKKVLIIGGGDGGTAREVLRHQNVSHVTMVEIDGMVVDVSRKFLPQTSCELDNPRLDLKIADGVQFVAETKEKFDVILVDSTDPIGPAAPLFGDEFYGNVYRILNENGIVVSQAESAMMQPEAQKSIVKSLRTHFPNVWLYNYTNLTYPGAPWSFSFAGKGDAHPFKNFSADRVKDSGLKFSYYTAGIHHATFQVPQYQQDIYEGTLTPLD